MVFRRREFLERLAALGALSSSGWPSLLAGAGQAAQRPTAGKNSSPRVAFRNVAVEAGVTPLIVCGGQNKQSILEVNGTGCVWFDYNNDGYVDLYIVNGSTLEHMLNPSASGPRPRNYLFRNNGDGTFTDVTTQAGVDGQG
ncbi:MAG TPA: VCBS repeat-containing protein, partial [Terriglobia bacterium]|nr:VCBS repeat-containing protein [Terriglobia bacterium]